MSECVDSAYAAERKTGALISPQEPAAELEHDGPIQAAVAGLLARSLRRDAKGQFLSGQVKTGAHSQQLFADLAPIKAEIVASVRHQLAADTDEVPPTLLAIIDGFAEAHLLRKSTFMQLTARGGPVTNKRKVRGLLQAWGAFFDREMRAAERLGLVRKSRRTQTPQEWLESLDNTAPEPEDTET